MIPFPTDKHRTYPCAFDFGTRQAQSGNRSPWDAGEASWPAAEESARRRGDCRSKEEKWYERRQTESAVGADESVLGKAQEAVGEGLGLFPADRQTKESIRRRRAGRLSRYATGRKPRHTSIQALSQSWSGSMFRRFARLTARHGWVGRQAICTSRMHACGHGRLCTNRVGGHPSLDVGQCWLFQLRKVCAEEGDDAQSSIERGRLIVGNTAEAQ